MCQVFKVSKSSYYEWLNKESCDRWNANESLLVSIKDIFAASYESYGSPRITEELRIQKIVVSKKRVAKIMQAAGILFFSFLGFDSVSTLAEEVFCLFFL